MAEPKACVTCPHGHNDCELVRLVQREIDASSDRTIGGEIQRALAREATARYHDRYGRKVPVCSKCRDTGWVEEPSCNGSRVLGMVPCDCPAGEQV